jgi:hypothetical protein
MLGHVHSTQLRVLRAGVRVTWGMAAAGGAYVAASWHGPNRWLIATVLVLAAIDGIVVSLLPHRRLMDRGAFNALMVGWNAAHVAAAALLCSLDGGPGSPFVTVFFVSVAFAAVALPRREMAIIASLDVLAMLGVAVLDSLADGSLEAGMLLWVGALVVAAAVCKTIVDQRVSHATALDRVNEEMLRRLARVVEFRDNDTGGHVERMSEYSALIAATLGYDEAGRHALQLAATMHDVGKVAVPDSILMKPGPLDPQERNVMERHAAAGHEMLSGSGSELLDLAATIALSHHERYDGAGYPQGLAGDDIPLPGRIVAVADAFDAVTSDRVYKAATPFDEAVLVILAGRGTQFDPAVVDAFASCLDAIAEVHAAHHRTRVASAPFELTAAERVPV